METLVIYQVREIEAFIQAFKTKQQMEARKVACVKQQADLTNTL